MAATAVPTTALLIQDCDANGDNLTLRWYSPDDDPNVAYGFCSRCGASLFFRAGVADGSNTVTSICVGSINGPSGLQTAEIWFVANAADHVRLDDPDVHEITVFAREPPD